MRVYIYIYYNIHIYVQIRRNSTYQRPYHDYQLIIIDPHIHRWAKTQWTEYIQWFHLGLLAVPRRYWPRRWNWQQQLDVTQTVLLVLRLQRRFLSESHGTTISDWWLGTFGWFFHILGIVYPNWLIFFRGVETTNQILFGKNHRF